LVSGMALFLQLDEISCFTAAFVWLALLIGDLKEAEMMYISWRKMALCAVVGTYVAGPGAVVIEGGDFGESETEGSCCKAANADRMVEKS
jgi:hypothetical protein